MDVPSWIRTWVMVMAMVLALPVEAMAQDCQTPVLGGYGEVFGTVATEDAGDGALQLRGFDNRVNTVSLSNLVLSAQFRCGDRGRGWGQVGLDAVVQIAGTTPMTYTLAEPSYMPRDGVGGSDINVARFVQQAILSWRRDFGARYLLVEAGLVLSPIGPEGMAVKDNWSWSRSNLFYGLPFYHTVLRVTRGWSSRWRTTIGGLNGWNSLVDNNDEKTLYAQVVYEVTRVTWSGLVMSGVERPPAAPEGRAWRTVFDTYLTWHASSWLSLQAHANAGFEPNNLGTAWWVAGAAYARVRPWPVRLPGLSFAARWDAFYEVTPTGGSSIFWPTSPGRPGTLISSGTLTGRLEIVNHAALYLEGRGDYSDAAIWVRERRGDEIVSRMPWRLTGTLGLTAWF